MKFKPHTLWKHRNNRDVAVYILKCFHVTNEESTNPRFKLKVEWWNIGPHPWWSMNIRERIEITEDKAKDWECIKC